MVKATPSSRSRRKGGALVEAVLVLPLLLLLTCGLIEFGYFIFMEHTFHTAARNGVRTAIPPGATSTEVTTAVSAMMSAAGISASNYTVTICQPDGTAVAIDDVTPGSEVMVRVTAGWGAVGLSPMGLIAESTQVTGVAVMRKEGQP